MKIKSHKVLIAVLSILFLSACTGKSKSNTNRMDVENEISKTELQNEKFAVMVEMEGKTFTLHQKELVNNILTIKNDTLQFVFYTNENPFQLNLNLNNTDILKQGSATYTIPDINQPKIKVDLSFFNNERDVKSMNKRIIFRKGTLNITKITEHQLQMTFEGEGSGMLEYGKNFPISGEATVNF